MAQTLGELGYVKSDKFTEEVQENLSANQLSDIDVVPEKHGNQRTCKIISHKDGDKKGHEIVLPSEMSDRIENDKNAAAKLDGKTEDNKGKFEGKTEGNVGKFEGKTEGITEGSVDKFEGKTQCKTEGKIEGKSEGKFEGKTEGKFEGKTEGKTEGTTEHTRRYAISDSEEHEVWLKATPAVVCEP
ncbi:hypothetical protein METBIDRAFT_12784 [Metschnikowia bicuspidata var. bicuspidata NRRL YB-4993]|uniref:Uncharacterized protein n=1 Tax=Metschnikowia bicuspidata var. bicuspidata NRRL YB-4993 TaxID=869754 RepID=A0A1A0H6L9_9ASCO|nr:hypothetical protein METBIDRAFT_12784 [Metschnikowia bicuspidata var. bicuspidata NRRL YB-4993]OBA19734.1 hypothetical protein METBIDRAFT_12784 [Metschnikowia bicuspidata var. bicuspidata NRRL YB-4993]